MNIDARLGGIFDVEVEKYMMAKVVRAVNQKKFGAFGSILSSSSVILVLLDSQNGALLKMLHESGVNSPSVFEHLHDIVFYLILKVFFRIFSLWRHFR